MSLFDWMTEAQSREAIRAQREPYRDAPWNEWLESAEAVEATATLERNMQPIHFGVLGPRAWICPGCWAVVANREIHAARHMSQAAMIRWLGEEVAQLQEDQP